MQACMRLALLLPGLLTLPFLYGCSGSTASGGGTDAAVEAAAAEGGHDASPDGGSEGGAPCTGVCGTPSGVTCASQFASSDCLGGSCCILAADSGPPYYDDAGTCPGLCASPDDIGCQSWYRTSACATGDLCCVSSVVHGDAGTD
jgi:hypothetical protein